MLQMREEEANAKADIEEGFPTDSPDPQKAPELKKIKREKEEDDEKDGIDKAMEQLEEYMEDVPPINPNVRNYEE